MVKPLVDEAALFKRLRDRYSTDEQCWAITKDIIKKRLRVWRVPTLNEV